MSTKPVTKQNTDTKQTRKLAVTANRSAFMSEKPWPGQGRGIVDLAKIFLSSTVIIIQNLAAVSHTVYMHGGPTKIGRCWGPTPCDDP